MPAPTIAVAGAGSVGCYIGGRLAHAGAAVTLVGRARIGAVIARNGLRLSDLHGFDARLAAEAVPFATAPEAAASADLVLVTVKSAATGEMADALAPVLRAGTVVISFQNGLRNAELLAERLPHCTVLAGMVPFNVVDGGDGHFHHGSDGELEVAESAALAPFVDVFAAAGVPLQQHADMPAVLWGKLLLNLNNAVNALSGQPLKAELSQRAYRRCVAAAQRETLALLDAAAIAPAKLTALPARWLPAALSVPDAVFRVLGNRMLAIDPLARSSMWEDLERGRRTEIDWINGEVVRLAERLGRAAPVNARLIALIREAEAGGRRDWDGPALLAELRAAR